jgi:hypothetical protein
MESVEIAFQEVVPTDIEKLQYWLNQDFIIGLYGEGPSTLEEVRAEYIPMILGIGPAYPY